MVDRHRVRKGQSAVASHKTGRAVRENQNATRNGSISLCAQALEPSRTVTHGQRAQRAGEGARTPREWPDAASSTSGGGKVWVASIGDTQTLAINAPSRSRGGGTAWLVSLLGFRCLVLFGVEALFPGQGRGAAIADICPRAQAHKMIRCISRDMATSSTPGRGTHGEDGVRVRLFVAPSTGQGPSRPRPSAALAAVQLFGLAQRWPVPSCAAVFEPFSTTRTRESTLPHRRSSRGSMAVYALPGHSETSLGCSRPKVADQVR